MLPYLNTEKENLFPSFTSQLKTNRFSQSTVKAIYSLLYDKMANLRKKDMEKSVDRLKTHKVGTSVTLNLRDELKPYAARVPSVNTKNS